MDGMQLPLLSKRYAWTRRMSLSSRGPLLDFSHEKTTSTQQLLQPQSIIIYAWRIVPFVAYVFLALYQPMFTNSLFDFLDQEQILYHYSSLFFFLFLLVRLSLKKPKADAVFRRIKSNLDDVW